MKLYFWVAGWSLQCFHLSSLLQDVLQYQLRRPPEDHELQAGKEVAHNPRWNSPANNRTSPLWSSSHILFLLPPPHLNTKSSQLYHFLLVILPFHCTCTLWHGHITLDDYITGFQLLKFIYVPHELGMDHLKTSGVIFNFELYLNYATHHSIICIEYCTPFQVWQ